MAISHPHNYRFFTPEYTILLALREAGKVRGVFQSLRDPLPKRHYACKGIYVTDPFVIDVVFSVEWVKNNSEKKFTLFSGQILNNNIMTLDWMLVSEGDGAYAINGSTVMFSAQYLGRGSKTYEQAKPYPFELKNNKTQLFG